MGLQARFSECITNDIGQSMRCTFFFLVFLIIQVGYSQLTLQPVHTENKSHTGSTIQRDARKNTLPFWEDFSITTRSPDSIRIWGSDTIKQWNFQASKNVLVNGNLGKNPPTSNVATFDGLTSEGQFHGTETGLTDELVSDTIDLSAFNEADDIIMSFYWQAGGNVEMPESGDSLVLQFYDPASTWETVWSADGGDVSNDSSFFQASRGIEQRFLTDQFVFRFQSYGDQDGPFDAWHVDWIYINQNRQSEDFFYLDRGFTGQLTSPFSPFKALPVSQFKANEAAFTSPQTVQAFNLDRFIQPTEYIIVIRDLINNTRIDSIQFGAENPLAPSSDPLLFSQERVIDFDGIDLSSLPLEDSIVIQSELYIESSDDDFLDGTAIDLRINDTLRAEYLLHDYYAFDDGSAEYAVGTNIRGGQVGVQFWLQEMDTLTHVDIYFPNIDPPSNDNSITLRIFRNLSDEFPQRSQSIQIQTATAIDEFTRYELARPLPLPADTFYVTYEQNVNEYIGIGFDRSNTTASRYIFENIEDQWVRNVRLQGAIMVRPVFRPVEEFTLGVSDIDEQTLQFYPNPTSGSIRIENDYHHLEIYNLSGQLLRSEKARDQHDISSLTPGLYLLSIQTPQGVLTHKIIKE